PAIECLNTPESQQVRGYPEGAPTSPGDVTIPLWRRKGCPGIVWLSCSTAGVTGSSPVPPISWPNDRDDPADASRIARRLRRRVEHDHIVRPEPGRRSACTHHLRVAAWSVLPDSALAGGSSRCSRRPRDQRV